MRILFSIFLILIIASCGTRKRLAHVEAIKKDVSLKQDNNIASNIHISESKTNTTYTPIDPDKPMILPDGRTATNVKIEEKKEDISKTENTIDLSKIDLVSKIKTNKKNVQAEAKKSNPYLWIFITIGTVATLYFGYRFLLKR